MTASSDIEIRDGLVIVDSLPSTAERACGAIAGVIGLVAVVLAIWCAVFAVMKSPAIGDHGPTVLLGFGLAILFAGLMLALPFMAARQVLRYLRVQTMLSARVLEAVRT